MSTDPAETTTTERLEHEADLAYEQVEALADADFKASVRTEALNLLGDHTRIEAALRVAKNNRLVAQANCDQLRAMEFSLSVAAAAREDVLDARDLLERFEGLQVVKERENVLALEDELHDTELALRALEACGFSDYPRVRLAALEQDAPF